MLVKAVVWRESRFDPQKLGGAGERGLMQVSEIAARDWAQEHRIENFRVEELFDPKTNLEAGTWYLRRAMLHWQEVRDPTPFALAVYNAGASRAQRWAGGDGTRPISAKAFQQEYRFPWDEELPGVDPRSLPFLSAPRANVEARKDGQAAGF